MQTTDIVAVLVFCACLFGFGPVADYVAKKRPSMLALVRAFRQRWMERMCQRDLHVADATLLSNLLRGALFFASTTVLILGGLAALLGTVPKMSEVIAELPYTAPVDPRLAELKALALILLFIYAFFKFTWSGWQYNILSILVGGIPDSGSAAEERQRYAAAAARVATLAGDSYNKGVRAYYFSIPLMSWFLNPVIFLAATMIVTVVLYRREFHSPVHIALGDVLT